MVIRIWPTSTRNASSKIIKFNPNQVIRRSSTKAEAGSPIYSSLPLENFSKRQPELQVDHLVVGAGVVGLAIAAQLATRWPEKTTYVVERNERAGEETR